VRSQNKGQYEPSVAEQTRQIRAWAKRQDCVTVVRAPRFTDLATKRRDNRAAGLSTLLEAIRAGEFTG
jgi:hypothetical protein